MATIHISEGLLDRTAREGRDTAIEGKNMDVLAEEAPACDEVSGSRAMKVRDVI